MSSDPKVIDDLIVIGRAAPDEISDGRQTFCVGGWSPKLNDFVRLYPTNVKSKLRRWNKVQVPVEKNDNDTRIESWKIEGSHTDWNELHKKVKLIDKLDRTEKLSLLRNLPTVTCIESLNEDRKSLGIISPRKIIKAYFIEREKVEDTRQSSLIEYDESDDFTASELFIVTTKKHFPLIPYVEWECEGPCQLKQGYHKSQIITFEVYEWFRKQPEDEWKKVFDNLRLYDDDYQKWFFVGNQKLHRRSFMIISILRFKEKIKSGKSLDDWF